MEKLAMEGKATSFMKAISRFCRLMLYKKTVKLEIHLCNFGQDFGKLVVFRKKLLYMVKNSNLFITIWKP